ncbi:MAG: hypothetical protein U1F53_06765 [Burkholderiaceae bacterium]
MSESTSSIPRAIVSPLSEADAHRLAVLVGRVGEGSAFVAMYSPERKVCANVIVVEGNITSWFLVPAENEAKANSIAQFLHAQTESAWQVLLDAAAGAIGKASRH